MPSVLQKTYFELNLGSIDYDFGADQFQAAPGYTFQSAERPPTAVHLALGYEINNYLSTQISLIRPLEWVRYHYTGSDGRLESSSLWMSIVGLTLRPQVPLSKHFSLFGEAGLGLVTRAGFEASDGTSLVTDADYAALLLGGGLTYSLNDHWGLKVSAPCIPLKNSRRRNRPHPLSRQVFRTNSSR